VSVAAAKLIAVLVDASRLRRRGVVRLLQDWAKAENLELVSLGPFGLAAGLESQPRMVFVSTGAEPVTNPDIGTILRNLSSLVSGVPLVTLSDRDDSAEPVEVFRVGSDEQPLSSRRPQARSILTSRQGDVANLLSQGLSNKLIARQLAITEATVKVHIRQIMRKLGASNRTQAALLTARVLAAAEPEKSAADAD
jgi:DNA-binding NarL/FixJ family response regulator